MAELHGEKIDIVDYSEDPAEFVANALSPARVTRVEVMDRDAMEARVTVPDYQLSLAIGKEGQNARLAARLTGWRIDIRSDAAPAPSEAPDAPEAADAPLAPDAPEAPEAPLAPDAPEAAVVPPARAASSPRVPASEG
jgi:transcription termination/antitermination protein NusA